MKKNLALSLLFLFLLISCNNENGWQDLFNGKNMDGWVIKGGKAKFTVEDKAIVGETVLGNQSTFLCTSKNYGNFILELELNVGTSMNSGIQFRSQSFPEFKNGIVHGYQMEVDPSSRGWSGGIYDESRQIDTVHWFTGYSHPRSVAAGGGIYLWKDGRENFDTMTAVFDYGPSDDKTKGFQVVYSSRFTNSSGGVKELYFSNGGTLNLDTNTVSSDGGLEAEFAKPMGMKPNLLESFKLPQVTALTGSNLGSDPMTFTHMKNCMECVRSRKEANGNIHAAYNHSIANIMTNAALHTGEKAVFNEQTQQVMAGNKIFKY